MFIEQRAESTGGDGEKSEESIKWPASKKRDLILPGNSGVDCPATQGPLDTGAHIFNINEQGLYSHLFCPKFFYLGSAHRADLIVRGILPILRNENTEERGMREWRVCMSVMLVGHGI